jgi:choline dehydrogenase-like flavoprotein
MYDALVIGSGFGGSMAAHRLVRAGWRVLMLERGDWVPRRPDIRDPGASMPFTPQYSRESEYRCGSSGWEPRLGSVFCVGGPSVFYGGVSLRFREEDFAPSEEITGNSGAAWPFHYDELDSYYGEAERILGVAGDDSEDPTRPPRRDPYPYSPAPLARVSERFRDAARDLGLHPFPLPLAINFASNNGRTPCDGCRVCDTYACAIEAKNDTSVAVVGPLAAQGLEVLTNTVVTQLVATGSRISEVRAWDRTRRETISFKARHIILAAGALASPHLLLASGLERVSSAGHAVGTYLMRHCSGMVFGFCNNRPDPEKVFHKQLAVFDYYRGDPTTRGRRSERIGSIQQLSPPPKVLVESHGPRILAGVPLGGFVEHLVSALVMVEDEPHVENGVSIDWTEKDAVGLPRLDIRHTYSSRDEERRRRLARRAKRILRRLGAWSFHTMGVRTFSHALGTVRMGTDSATSPLDGWCRYRGLDNLLVVDGSAMPTSGAVNPSLTIAAIALRAADHLATGESA